MTARYEGIYAVGFALVAFGLADVTFGNGLIAAFVCGIAMAATEREVPEGFVEFAENASAILQVLTFFVFGALIVATGFHHSVPPLVVFVVFALLVARPAAVLLSFLRTGLPRSEKLFMAWFGPKGVASMLFALFVLKSQVGDGTLIFDVASLVIIASIVAHGLTDTVGARWMAQAGRLRPLAPARSAPLTGSCAGPAGSARRGAPPPRRRAASSGQASTAAVTSARISSAWPRLSETRSAMLSQVGRA